jgi:hypothetical protein
MLEFIMNLDSCHVNKFSSNQYKLLVSIAVFPFILWDSSCVRSAEEFLYGRYLGMVYLMWSLLVHIFFCLVNLL